MFSVNCRALSFSSGLMYAMFEALLTCSIIEIPSLIWVRSYLAMVPCIHL